MSMSSKISEQFLHPLTVGLVATVGSYAMGDAGLYAIVGGMGVPLPIFIGITSGLSSAAGETIKQWVLPMLPYSQNLASLESTFLLPAIVGTTSGAAMYLLTRTRGKEGFILGAGSEVLGSYLYDGVIKNYVS